MLYNHSYNSKAKDEFSGAAVISVDPGKAEMLEVKIQRSPEPLMCAADVDFYPLDLLRETTTGSRSWFCLGRPRKISMGVKSLTDEGMATLVVLQETNGKEQPLVQREIKLSLELDPSGGKVDRAMIVDGPLLITC